MSTRVNIEKKRMEFAFNKAKGAPNPKKYDSYVQKVPAFIMTNGLGNTMAFIASQSDANWQKVGDDIFDWLDSEHSVFKGELTEKLNKLKEQYEQLEAKKKQLENEIKTENNKEIKKIKIKEKKDTEEKLKKIKLDKSFVLLEKLKNENDAIIKLCTSETLALLNWLRRFSKVYR